MEYKQAVSKSYLKTVSAFANYNDGQIVFGLSDDLRVIGIDCPIDVCLNIENQINDSIKPRPDYELKINKDNTISLFVKRGRNTPYRFDGKAYKRSDTSTVEVDDIEEKRLILSGMNISFEELSCGEDDLKFDYLGEKLSEALNLENFGLDTMKSLNLYNQKTGYNNAAKLLADHNDFPGLDVAVFGNSINVFRKRRTFSGESLLKQYFDCIELYKDEYVVEKIADGLRQKSELIPIDAFREALANALVHRVWDIKADTKVEMHPDRVIISSPGGLPADMSVDDYVRGNYSYLRNPILANVFRRMNIIEAFATGIRRINEAYKDVPSKPVYNVSNASVSVTLPIIDKAKLTEGERRVLDSLKENRLYSRAEIEKISGTAKDTLIRILNSLIEKGFIEKAGQARGTSYRKK
ncbi:MAG: ATP-binding protein [Bacillota bacterium]|nr:ATP-binding protein [Bacillota bacterium]